MLVLPFNESKIKNDNASVNFVQFEIVLVEPFNWRWNCRLGMFKYIRIIFAVFKQSPRCRVFGFS